MSNECLICAEKYTKVSRAKVTCPYCQKDVCTECFKTYLLTNNKLISDCMHCKGELSLDFVNDNTNKTFYSSKFRDKRADILLSQEKSLLPDTQYLVEREIVKERYENNINEMYKEIRELKQKINIINLKIGNERTLLTRHLYGGDRKRPAERKKFIMKCTVENCRGFLSTSWKCGTCETWVCPTCRVPKTSKDDEEHVCNPDDVATAKMLTEEVKNCPKCAVPIFKIDGCDQMWCVECETPFSWRTLEIITNGTIHNPHFYQRQRELNNGVAPRVPGDNPCADRNAMPWPNVVEAILISRNIVFPNWHECHRLVGHIRDVTIRYYPYNNRIEDNSDLRVKFLRNRISEKAWKGQLKQRQKSYEKNRAVHNVLEVFYVSLTDLFNSFVSGQLENIHEAAIRLAEYCNREFSIIRKTFSNKIPYIDIDHWVVKTK